MYESGLCGPGIVGQLVSTVLFRGYIEGVVLNGLERGWSRNVYYLVRPERGNFKPHYVTSQEVVLFLPRYKSAS